MDVAIDSLGNFTVVWQSWWHDGDNYGVAAKRFDTAGLPLGPEFQANTEIIDGQSSPSVNMSPTGEFIIAWESYFQDGSGIGIFAQRYSAALPVGLNETVIETAPMLYPNPVKDVLYIKNLNHAINDITFFNIGGQEVYRINNSPKKAIALNHLPTGIYTVQIKNKQSNSTYKIVKE